MNNTAPCYNFADDGRSYVFAKKRVAFLSLKKIKRRKNSHEKCFSPPTFSEEDTLERVKKISMNFTAKLSFKPTSDHSDLYDEYGLPL